MEARRGGCAAALLLDRWSGFGVGLSWHSSAVQDGDQVASPAGFRGGSRSRSCSRSTPTSSAAASSSSKVCGGCIFLWPAVAAGGGRKAAVLPLFLWGSFCCIFSELHTQRLGLPLRSLARMVAVFQPPCRRLAGSDAGARRRDVAKWFVPGYAVCAGARDHPPEGRVQVLQGAPISARSVPGGRRRRVAEKTRGYIAFSFSV